MKTFTTPCFIRKNTKELREKLEELGYHVFGLNNEPNLYAYTSTNNKGVVVGWALPFLPKDAIDCSTNEALFLAIAALREDSDKFQHFTDGKVWILCLGNKFTEWVFLQDEYIEFSFDTIHKATAKELIEHFK